MNTEIDENLGRHQNGHFGQQKMVQGPKWAVQFGLAGPENAGYLGPLDCFLPEP